MRLGEQRGNRNRRESRIRVVREKIRICKLLGLDQQVPIRGVRRTELRKIQSELGNAHSRMLSISSAAKPCPGGGSWKTSYRGSWSRSARPIPTGTLRGPRYSSRPASTHLLDDGCRDVAAIERIAALLLNQSQRRSQRGLRMML